MALLRNAIVGLFLVFHTCTWGAWAVMEVNMEDRVEVFRRDTAQITCMFESADGMGGVMIQWFYSTPPTSSGTESQRHRIFYQDSTMQIVDKGTPFSDRISVNGTGATGELVLTIRDVQLEDALDFICHAKGLTDGEDEKRTQLKVFETPELPTIERLHTGISVLEKNPSKIGSCEAKNGFPRPNITWYRDSTPLQNIPNEVQALSLVTLNSGLYSVKSDLSMMVTKEDKDALFYCEVTYLVPGGTRMTETTRINVTVHYPTTSIRVWVESPKGDIKEGDTVELQCRGDGYPQPTLSFFHETEEKSANTNGVLVLKGVTRADSGAYRCESWDFEPDEPVHTLGNTTLMVNYLDRAVVVPEVRTLSLGEGMTATCNALSSLLTKTVWFKDGQQTYKGHVLTLKNAMFDTAGTYVCVVTVPTVEGMETEGTLRVFVQGPPEIREPQNTPIEESLEKTVNLSCHARGYPVPSISWSSSDAQVLKSVSQKQTEDAVHSVVSVKVTSDITAYCNASNDHGSEAVSFSIKAIKHTTKPASTTTTTSTSAATVKSPTVTVKSPTASVKSPTVSVKTPTVSPKKVKKEGSGVIIAVIIICILLLAILGSVLYFLYKKGKICGRSGKQDLTKEKSNKDNIVVEMKSDNTEEAVLLGVNGDKKLPNDQ